MALKKLLVKLLVFVTAVFIISAPASADMLPGYEGGIMDDMKYREMIFITGQPVLLEGSVKVTPGRMRDGKRQDRITYNLSSSDGSVKLSRSITISVTLQREKGKDQVRTTYEIVRASETVTVKRDRTTERFTLENYSFTASSVSDISAAVDYTTTVIRGRKVYDFNGGKGTVEVDISGKGVGYSSAWGSTETREVKLVISSNRKADEKNGTQASSWTGTVDEELSSSRTVEISYVENRPALMSFDGAYAVTTREDSTVRYSYSLPRLDENGLPTGKQNRGSELISLSATPRVEMGYIPEFYDMAGHWARQDVGRLAALGIMKQEGNYFWPQIPAKRLEFVLAVGRLVDINSRAERWRDSSEEEAAPAFEDLSLSKEDASIVAALAEMGVVEGISPRRFSPNQNLTRAQVVTILVRALGLEKNVPRMYRLGFRDEGEIPAWAKDAVYVGSSIGLVRGDEAGYFRPDDPVTRAEAAALLNRFITYLKDDLRRDFRDRVMDF
ncbi:S-layer homology domain-containing protein [Fervidicola ferrireducens]|uniref:S-layer homology domain-containing protein n=1 Tax=Fervidicola ferrireducens TaxID=520764 RepID=UPI0009FA2783|nr:S-layer homology domain-containing protein [Fervidicola ferrireducens]